MASKLGHHQVLWLFGPDHQLTEVGAMNIFAVYVNEQGGKNIINVAQAYLSPITSKFAETDRPYYCYICASSNFDLH